MDENDPTFQAWAERVKVHVLPKISESAMTVSLVPKADTDIKFAVELGLSIMLDKPIIAIIRPGTKVSEHLVRVADRIIEDTGDMAKLQEAMMAAMREINDEGDDQS